MIKRVNFTGRRRIARDRVDISVYDGQPRTFDANIDLDGLEMLPHAAVFVEATCAGSTVVQRFQFGEVGGIVAPQARRLDELDGENVFFTLKVVDRTERFGRILGIAEHIRPQRAGKQTVAGRRGILAIEPVDTLGQQLWRLELGAHDVILQVNRSVPGLVDRARSDPLFYAVVYPEVVRHVLRSAIEENVDPEEDDDRWPVLWLRFGKNLHPGRENPPKPDDSDEDQEEWVERVVEEFCQAHAFRDKFLAASNGNGGDA
jgi:hypothetical protein